MKKFFLSFALSCAVLFSVQGQENKVKLESIQLSGYEMIETMNEDGTDLVKRPYKWFAGIGSADDKQLAVEIAQREAYATISRVLENIVEDECQRSSLAVDGKVNKAVRSYWKQVSQTITKGCEPFGKATIELDTVTKVYEVIAKVAIRGDRFIKLLGEAKEVKPEGLNVAEMQDFIDVNKAIIDAAKEN